MALRQRRAQESDCCWVPLEFDTENAPDPTQIRNALRSAFEWNFCRNEHFGWVHLWAIAVASKWGMLAHKRGVPMMAGGWLATMKPDATRFVFPDTAELIYLRLSPRIYHLKATSFSMHNHIRTKIDDIFREVFDDDQLQVSDSLSTESLPTWDSLAHIRLVSALEDGLSLTFTLEDIETMTSVARIVTVVESKG